MSIGRLKFDFKQEADSDKLVIRLYGEVKPDSRDWWTGEIIKSKTSQEYFATELDKYPNVKTIELYINSCGGFVDEGYGIYANLKRHPAQKNCYIDGFANSIASIIAMACDKIIMYCNSTMVIHNISSDCYGNASDHRKCAEYLDKLMEGNREIYLQRSAGKITPAKLTELLDAETCLTAEECLSYGFCDEIETAKPADPQEQDEALKEEIAAIKQSLKQLQALRQAYKTAFADGEKPSYDSPPPLPPKAAELDLSACMEKALRQRNKLNNFK